MHMVTHALVLREVNYKESDKILTVLTRENGKMTLSARGCRKKGRGRLPLCGAICKVPAVVYRRFSCDDLRLQRTGTAAAEGLYR